MIQRIDPKSTPALPLPEAQAWPALIALCIGFFMILLDQTIVAVATPVLQAELNASYSEIIWVTSAYLLTFAVPLLITGRLGDRYGARSMYITGMMIFTLSSLACGLAGSMTLLIIARAIQGFGASLLTPQTMSVINRIFAKERRGAALGVWGTVAGLAGLTGPLLGGLITEAFGWQWIFFINLPLGVISVIAVWAFVPNMEKLERGIDIWSMVLSVLAVFAIVYALQEGETAQWTWWVWALIIVGIVLVYVFLRRQRYCELQGKEPLMPLSLWKNRNFAFGNLGIAAMGFAVAGTPLPMMLYYQGVHDLTPLHAGLMMAPQAIVSAVLSPFVGRLADKISPALLSAGGFAVYGLSFLLLGVCMMQQASLWWFGAIMVVSGLGTSFVWSPNSTLTMRDVPLAQMGASSGVYNTTRQVGSVLGSAAIGAVLQWRIAATEFATAYGQAIFLATVILFVGVTASLYSHKHVVAQRTADTASGRIGK
ncbi:MAG: DHA2 family efflux MFS transporter permease subunit [Corynebacterium sp.]|nr:DHA2 family efflux MFS transporter permease subunit [Corynebacterium sp.]